MDKDEAGRQPYGGRVTDIMSLTDIAVLKSEVAGLHEAITEVSTKMDLVLSMRVELSVQSERLEHQQAETSRVRDGFNREIGSISQKVDDIAEHAGTTRTKLDAWLNRIIGGVAVGALAVGLLQYAVLQKLQDVDRIVDLVRHNTAQIDLITKVIRPYVPDLSPPRGDSTQLQGGGNE